MHKLIDVVSAGKTNSNRFLNRREWHLLGKPSYKLEKFTTGTHHFLHSPPVGVPGRRTDDRTHFQWYLASSIPDATLYLESAIGLSCLFLDSYRHRVHSLRLSLDLSNMQSFAQLEAEPG